MSYMEKDRPAYEAQIKALVPKVFFDKAQKIVEAHKPTDPQLKDFEPVAMAGKWSAQVIVQALCALRILRVVGPESVYKQLIHDLNEQIGLWGGMKNIENWLQQYDPCNAVPSEIEGMDWSWMR